MSNSSLVNFTRISPNRNSPRSSKIDTISIHCVVGQCSVETLGSIFASSSREASSNYGIGYDGRIGMYVEEKDRSWCTSSAYNDNRTITIEVASDTYDPYRVNDAAYKALIKLLVDICKRNGIKKLVWSTNKNERMNHLNGCNMTVHRDYANKSCPGDYLYNLHGQIAKEVNAQLGSGSSTPTTTTTTTPTKVTAPDITYLVKSGGKWTSAVKNGKTVGAVGKAITDVAIKAAKGSVKYRVHVKGGGWLPYVTGYNTNDYNNGYAGNGKPIDAVEVYYTTPSDIAKSGYLRAKYRVSPLNGNFYDYQYDNEKTGGQDGYAGSFGKTIDRLQLTLSL